MEILEVKRQRKTEISSSTMRRHYSENDKSRQRVEHYYFMIYDFNRVIHILHTNESEVKLREGRIYCAMIYIRM